MQTWFVGLSVRLLLPFALAAFLPASVPAVEWVTIDDPRNAPDDLMVTCCDAYPRRTGFGAVDYVYEISKFEHTNAEYAEFLNAVAWSDDPNGLYAASMAKQIVQTGSPGNYAYEPVVGRENWPIAITVLASRRFANWLHNGKPVGPQGPSTTEDGAYTLGADLLFVERNPEALVVVPNEDEWYKAAYYDPGLASYWLYPAGSDLAQVAEFPPGGMNSGNYKAGAPADPCEPNTQSPCEPTDVGAYVLSESPFGTFDQGGNRWEWLEETFVEPGSGATATLVRGGWYGRPVVEGAAYFRASFRTDCDNCAIGFRTASIPAPEPSHGLSAIVGLVVVMAAHRVLGAIRLS